MFSPSAPASCCSGSSLLTCVQIQRPLCPERVTRVHFPVGNRVHSRNCGFLSGPKALTLVAYLSSISSIMCIIIDLVLVLALTPMPYYIFPNAFSEPKTRRGDVLSASLVSPPPPLLSTALLRCAASCALGRGPVCEGVAAGWHASQTARRTAFSPRACSHNWTRAPLCVPQGLNPFASAYVYT
jgi:hypothetical protein